MAQQLRVSTCSSLIQYKLQITKQLLLNYVSLHVTAVEVCSGHSFLASCQSDEVVVMTSALYGRMSIGTCVERNMGALGCRSDVIDVAHNACSGRRRCELRVRNPDMDRRMRAESSCANATELSRYLDADYRCQQGKYRSCFEKCSASFHIHNPRPSSFAWHRFSSIVF